MSPHDGQQHAAAASAARAGEVAMLIVSAGGQAFALPADGIRSVTRLGQLVRVPAQPPHVLGLANVRGQIVMVIDLACRLGDDAGNRPEGGYLVTLSRNGQTCGIAVEAVGGVAAFGPDDSVSLPAPQRRGRARFFTGWLRGPDGLVEALDTDALCGFDTPGNPGA